MGVTPSRVIARKALSDVRANGAYTAQAVSRALDSGEYSAQDVGYGSRLAHMSIGSYHAVSNILSQYLDKPHKLPPLAHDALVVSATELLYLDAPDHAVDQGVELAKASYPRLAGVANAVLRKIAGSREEILRSSPAFEYGFPGWLADQLIGEYGEKIARHIMSASNEQAPIFGYVLSVAPDDWEAQLTDAGANITNLGNQSIIIGNTQAVRTHPLIASRATLIADIGAQTAISLAPIGSRMLEVASGRGTKSLMWADRARLSEPDGIASFVGIDNVAHKVERAAEEARILGYDEITYTVDDATQLAVTGGEKFDVVFVDAPCSGLGTLRRHADKRMTLEPGDIDDLAMLSLSLLRNAARKVAKDGTLVYATCTISRRENDSVISEFLASPEGADFQIDRINNTELPALIGDAVTPEGFVQMLPQPGGGDGHFVARLKRA